MKWHAVLFLASGLLLAADDAQDDKEDKDNIQGKWAVIAFERSGKEVNGFRDSELAFVFDGNKWGLFSKVAPTFEGKFKLDPVAKPKQIDFILGDKTQPGIYELDGDDLKICYAEAGGERPAEFKSTPESKATLIIYKREKN